jgi:RHS repeat-associated protein
MYRYAFQGQELDKETGMEAFQLRLWDGRIGRWLSPDPYGQYASPYLGMGNNPIGMIDPDGGFACDTCPKDGNINDFHTSPEGHTYQNLQNGGWTQVGNSLNEVYISSTSGGNSALSTTGEIALGFVPGSDIIGMYQGARDGNWGQFALATAFFTFDVVTLGSGSLVKGGIKAAIKVGAKELAEEGVEIGTKRLLLTAGKKTLPKHHVLPQQFRKWFAERGIKNIDDYTVKLSQKGHQNVHNAGQWNKKWQAFIDANPTANPNEIFHQAENMLNESGLQHLPYVKY